MTEDWEKKYWDKVADNNGVSRSRTLCPPSNPRDLPHYEPAHVTQNRERNYKNISADGWQDLDATSALQNRAMPGPAQNSHSQTSQMVMVQEGAVYYRSIQNDGFGTTMPMVRNCGPIVGVTGKEFQYKRDTHCYLIDNMNVVDLSEINPNKMLNLVEVSAPFLGSFLVEKSSIIPLRQPGPARPQILND